MTKCAACSHTPHDDECGALDLFGNAGAVRRCGCNPPTSGRGLSHDESGCSPDCGCPRCPNGYPSPHEHVGDACAFPEITPARPSS